MLVDVGAALAVWYVNRAAQTAKKQADILCFFFGVTVVVVFF